MYCMKIQDRIRNERNLLKDSVTPIDEKTGKSFEMAWFDHVQR